MTNGGDEQHGKGIPLRKIREAEIPAKPATPAPKPQQPPAPKKK